jgi:hypothetical protein
MVDDASKTADVNTPPKLAPPSSPPQKPKKSGVPVGLGIVLGVLLVIAGTFASLFPDEGPDGIWEARLGKLFLVCGAALTLGGLFVFLAERKQKHPTEVVREVNPRTPKWAYVFAGVCCLVGLLGGFIGGLCGFGGAGMCIAFSRNQALSAPRRIYACILTAGFSWVVYFALVDVFYPH